MVPLPKVMTVLEACLLTFSILHAISSFNVFLFTSSLDLSCSWEHGSLIKISLEPSDPLRCHILFLRERTAEASPTAHRLAVPSVLPAVCPFGPSAGRVLACLGWRPLLYLPLLPHSLFSVTPAHTFLSPKKNQLHSPESEPVQTGHIF